MSDTRYIKADLADHADFTNITWDDRGSPSRSDLLRDALGVEDVKTVCSGGWQGTFLFITVVDDLLWVVKDSYGSCAVCDGFLSAKDEDRDIGGNNSTKHIREYGRSMMNNAYAFESKNDAVRFLHEKDEENEFSSFGWGSVAEDAIEELAEVDY